MNTERIKEWTAALRSGKYKQAKGALATYDEAGNCTGHCCLGVLADITPGHEAQLAQETGHHLSAGRGLCTTELVELLDFPRVGRVPILASDLMNMNDNLNQPFPEIADYIERQCGITQENP